MTESVKSPARAEAVRKDDDWYFHDHFGKTFDEMMDMVMEGRAEFRGTETKHGIYIDFRMKEASHD